MNCTKCGKEISNDMIFCPYCGERIYHNVIDIIENHMSYMDQTIKTIDNMIFNITNRIKIEEIKMGR